jgi:thymidylate kinase
MATGKLIVFEGTDGSGKTTQLELLKKRLISEGKQVEIADFPRYGQKSAYMVEEYLNGNFGTAEEVGPYRGSIFYACDRYAASFEMKKWLKDGRIILSNRYSTSNMAHQSGKIKDLDARDKYLDWEFNLEHKIFDIPEPDQVIYLYLDPAVSQQLALHKISRHDNIQTKQDIHENDLGHLKAAAEAGLYLVKKYGWQLVDCNDGKGGIRAVEDIHEEIYEKIKDHFD